MRTSYSPNEELQSLISELKQTSSMQKTAIWKYVASDLSRPTRMRREVNLTRINNNTADNDIVVVAGKVLSSGELDHKIQIAAYRFSQNAVMKIEKSKGKVMTIAELLKSNPKGKGIKIIG